MKFLWRYGRDTVLPFKINTKFVWSKRLRKRRGFVFVLCVLFAKFMVGEPVASTTVSIKDSFLSNWTRDTYVANVVLLALRRTWARRALSGIGQSKDCPSISVLRLVLTHMSSAATCILTPSCTGFNSLRWCILQIYVLISLRPQFRDSHRPLEEWNEVLPKYKAK